MKANFIPLYSMELCYFHFVPNFEECSLGVIVNYKSPNFWELHESWTLPILNLVHLIFEIGMKDKVIMQWAACLIYPQNHEIWNMSVSCVGVSVIYVNFLM